MKNSTNFVKPIITFIIPTIGRKTLERTINSILGQTNTNWECIVIFDGVEVIEYNDNRIKCIYIDKKGVFGSSQSHGLSGLVRDEGIRLSSTPWVGFVDDDDTLHPKYVETLLQKYLKYDFVVWRMKYNNGRILPELGNNKIEFAQVGISFCYKNKFPNLLFNSNRNGEDFDFLQKLQIFSKNWVVAPEIYYNVNH